MKKNILVLCTGNSCRSQMAHGYLNHFGEGRINVYSAGVEKHGLNPFAVGIMAEDGVDISHHTSVHVDDYVHITFDYILTVCDHAKESCPIFISEAQKFHHNFSDPTKLSGSASELVQAFRSTRDNIKQWCLDFIRDHI